MENNTQQYSVSLEKLVEQVKALREQEQSLAKQQEALNKAFKEGKITEQQYANANNRLSLQIQATRQRITQTANATKSLAQTAKQSKSEMDDYGQTINGVGDALGRLGGIGVGGFGEIGNAIKSLVSGPFGMLTLAIGAVSTLWNKLKDGIERETEESADRLTKSLEKISSAREKSLDRSLDLVHQQNELVKQGMKTEEERVRYQQKRDEMEINKLREIALGLKKKYNIQVDIAKVDEEIARLENLNSEEKSSAKIKSVYIRDIEHLKEIKGYVEKIDALAKDSRTKEFEIILARQKDRANEEKAQEERARKRKELAERDKQNRISAERAVEDIEIQLIEDANERQLAQIELNKKRALQAIDEIYSKASNETKMQLDIQKKAVEELAEYQASQVKYAEDVFKLGAVELDSQTKQELELMRKRLDGAKKIQAETAVKLDQLEQERLNNLEKEREAYERLIEQIKKANISEQDRLSQTEQAERQHAENIGIITANAELKKEKAVMETNERIRQNNAQMIQSWASVGGSISSILGVLADQEETDSKRQLRLQKAQIYIAMAGAMAQGIGSAMDLPFPANLVASVATLAELVALFAQVDNMKDKAQYAKGGYVQGKGSGTSDSIDAKLSNGEYVVNSKRAQANLPLLDTINYGGENSLAKQFAIALQTMPNPIVAVTSIEDATKHYQNTKVYSHI